MRSLYSDHCASEVGQEMVSFMAYFASVLWLSDGVEGERVRWKGVSGTEVLEQRSLSGCLSGESFGYPFVERPEFTGLGKVA